MVANHFLSVISVVLIALLLTDYNVLAATDDGHDHDEHEDEFFEWAGVFEVVDPTLGHTLLLEKAGVVHEPGFTLQMIVVQTSTGDEAGLEEAHLEAEEIHEHQNATQVSGVTINIAVDTLYQISPSADSWLTNLNIQFSGVGYFAVFLEHGIEELCSAGEDCLRDSEGGILEPLFVEEAAHGSASDNDEDVDWGNTMAGAFVVWCAVFSGILLLSCGTAKYHALTGVNVHLISMFAAGALLATAFCLIMLEAAHFIEGSGGTEAEVAGIWGGTILAGFTAATIIDIVKDMILYDSGTVTPAHNCQTCDAINSDSDHTTPSQKQQGTADTSTAAAAVVVGAIELGPSAAAPAPAETDLFTAKKEKELDAQIPLDTPIKANEAANVNGLVASILVGDFLHNFCDGVFIGAAFQSCSASLGWTIVATTACHEFAQEIADFIILTKRAGLSIQKALIMNALSGFSVILGGIVVSANSLSNLRIGILLAFGSGNYIYLAASELYPSIHSSDTEMPLAHKVLGFALFALGACAVGLVLLNHEHCDTSGGRGQEDAHGH